MLLSTFLVSFGVSESTPFVLSFGRGLLMFLTYAAVGQFGLHFLTTEFRIVRDIHPEPPVLAGIFLSSGPKLHW